MFERVTMNRMRPLSNHNTVYELKHLQTVYDRHNIYLYQWPLGFFKTVMVPRLDTF